MHLTTANYDRVVQWGLSLDITKPLETSTAKLRVVVRDNPSGSVGSVTIPLKPDSTPDRR